MNKRILVLPGDGIGPEVTAQAVLVLQQVATQFGHEFEFTDGLIGANAIAATGQPLPEITKQQLNQMDAVLLGAVGLPEYDNNPTASVRPEQGLLQLRKTLGVYTNIRPVTIYSELANASSIKPEILSGVDILFFRELISGIYFGEPRQRSQDGEEAIDTMRYNKTEVRRIVKMAFAAAQRRRKQLCSVDKANVLECSRLWREVVQAEATNYPDVTITHLFVDNAAMQLIRNPKQFDVIVTENMFGDILTDEAAQLSGSLGLLASASVGDGVGIFEPIHGSAPDIAGQNTANPIAAILSAALLCEHSGLMAEANWIRQAIQTSLSAGWRTADIFMGGATEHLVGTSQFTDQVIKQISITK